MTDKYISKNFGSVGGGDVYRLPEETKLDPSRSQQLQNHSPDGFQCGYRGSGPAQLALALLLDVTDDPEVAQEHYQSFKNDVVAKLDDNWTLTVEEIEQYIENRE